MTRNRSMSIIQWWPFFVFEGSLKNSGTIVVPTRMVVKRDGQDTPGLM